MEITASFLSHIWRFGCDILENADFKKKQHLKAFWNHYFVIFARIIIMI